MGANEVRKNFVFKKEIAEYLEELAAKNNKSMTAVVSELIEKEYEEYSITQKLEALHKFAGSGTGLYGNLTIQEIKANRDV